MNKEKIDERKVKIERVLIIFTRQASHMSLDVSIVMIRQKSNDSLNNYIVRFTRETLQVRNLISGLSQTLQVRNLICYICICMSIIWINYVELNI